ncbi:MAG TPA: hypothetical protein C5S50_02960 [Methanosarcinaceae archaeon]|nr:hypothetical protein [Methanosarcinaceae archaeon]
MTGFAGKIRQLMGWCPNITPAKYRSIQPVDFEYASITPIGKTVNIQKVQSNNVIFLVNTSLTYICFAIAVSLPVSISCNLEYSILFTMIVALYTSYYLIGVKILQAKILIDENGVYLKSFGLRNITLNYKDIKSIKSSKKDVNKYSKKTSIAVMCLMFAGGFATLAYIAILGEWGFMITITPMILLYYREEKVKSCYGLNTRMYIESRKKKWYELSPCYSVIIDETTSAEIRDSIEHYMEAQ